MCNLELNVFRAQHKLTVNKFVCLVCVCVCAFVLAMCESVLYLFARCLAHSRAVCISSGGMLVTRTGRKRSSDVCVCVSPWVCSASQIQMRFTYIWTKWKKQRANSQADSTSASTDNAFEAAIFLLILFLPIARMDPWVCKAENSDPCIVTHAKFDIITNEQQKKQQRTNCSVHNALSVSSALCRTLLISIHLYYEKTAARARNKF